MKGNVNMYKYVFFRVDDVCTLSQTLMSLTDIFVKYDISVSYQVIPNKLENDTISYLNDDKIKKCVSDIGQHGYQHKKWGRGEFNNNRSYEEQRNDILLGLELVRKKFPYTWNGVFSFPWGQFDKNTLKILSENNFTVYSKQFKTELVPRIANSILRLTKKEHFGKHNISYNELKRNNIREISICIDFNSDYEFNTLKTYDEIITEYERARKVTNYIGFLLHPNHINNNEGIDTVEKVIRYLRNSNKVEFLTISDISYLLDRKDRNYIV